MTQVNTQEAKNLRSGVNIAGTITGLGERRTVNLKSGGTVDIQEATLSDEAGDIILQLWAEDIAKIKKGSKVLVENGYTNLFKGKASITKGKFGKLTVVE